MNENQKGMNVLIGISVRKPYRTARFLIANPAIVRGFIDFFNSEAGLWRVNNLTKFI